MTALLVWPQDLAPSEQQFFLETNVGVLESPFSRTTQTITRGGPRWVCSMGFEALGPEAAAQMDALVNQLDGPAGEVRLWDWRRPVPSLMSSGTLTFGALSFGSLSFVGYPATGRPVTAGVQAAGADTLATSGWPASAPLFRAGEYVELAGRLHMVVAAVSSDGSGNAAIGIRPRLRASVAAGVELSLVRPSARFRLTGNSEGRNRTGNGIFSSYALTFVESLP